MVTRISNQEIINFLTGQKQKLANLLEGIATEEQSLDQSQWRAISRGLRNAPEYQGAVDLTRSLRNEQDQLARDFSQANSSTKRSDIRGRITQFNEKLDNDSQNPIVQMFKLLESIDFFDKEIAQAQLRVQFQRSFADSDFEQWMRNRPPSPLEISKKIADLVLESCGNALQGLHRLVSGVMHNNNSRQ
jgi:hypothetical protein